MRALPIQVPCKHEHAVHATGYATRQPTEFAQHHQADDNSSIVRDLQKFVLATRYKIGNSNSRLRAICIDICLISALPENHANLARPAEHWHLLSKHSLLSIHLFLGYNIQSEVWVSKSEWESILAGKIGFAMSTKMQTQPLAQHEYFYVFTLSDWEESSTFTKSLLQYLITAVWKPDLWHWEFWFQLNSRHHRNLRGLLVTRCSADQRLRTVWLGGRLRSRLENRTPFSFLLYAFLLSLQRQIVLTITENCIAVWDSAEPSKSLTAHMKPVYSHSKVRDLFSGEKYVNQSVLVDQSISFTVRRESSPDTCSNSPYLLSTASAASQPPNV